MQHSVGEYVLGPARTSSIEGVPVPVQARLLMHPSPNDWQAPASTPEQVNRSRRNLRYRYHGPDRVHGSPDGRLDSHVQPTDHLSREESKRPGRTETRVLKIDLLVLEAVWRTFDHRLRRKKLNGSVTKSGADDYGRHQDEGRTTDIHRYRPL